MTKQETERLAIVETNQNNMSNDMQEMKNDIKEIKRLLTHADDKYISKHFSKWVVGVSISIGTLIAFIWTALRK